jgi:hypothetical protein
VIDLSSTGLIFIDYRIFIAALTAVLALILWPKKKVKDLGDYAFSNNQKFSIPVQTLAYITAGQNGKLGR